MPTVEARVLGKKRPLVPSWSIPAPDVDGKGPVLLRHLIEYVVRGEVRAYRERAAARAFVRCLSEEEIAEGTLAGKVDAGGRDVETEVDEDAAVATALQAFEDGMYLVLVDEQEMSELGAVVPIGPDTLIVFLRLAFLAGA